MIFLAFYYCFSLSRLYLYIKSSTLFFTYNNFFYSLLIMGAIILMGVHHAMYLAIQESKIYEHDALASKNILR